MHGKVARWRHCLKFLPNYHVKYYDYVVKGCGGVACNWCVLLEIRLILALHCNCEMRIVGVAFFVATVNVPIGMLHNERCT